MCNCGKKRSAFNQAYARVSKPAPLVPRSRVAVVQQNFNQTNQPVLFEYTGETALTVIGHKTRKMYRFNFPGDKQYIELNDVQEVSKIGVLARC